MNQTQKKIAEIINQCNNHDIESEHCDWANIERLSKDLADYFSKESKDFNRKQFLKDAGVSE